MQMKLSGITSVDFEYPGKYVGLIKMCLNETYSTVRIGKNLSDKFPVQRPETRR
jgi:hypothetical protein